MTSERNWVELARLLEIMDLLTVEQLDLLIAKAKAHKTRKEQQ